MRPQTLTYKKGNGSQVTHLEDTNTFLVHVSNLVIKDLFTPTILVEGIEDETVKFDFYKAYSNGAGDVMHCEYRSTHDTGYKLIIHTQ